MISIVTASHEQGEFLQRCITSVAAQSVEAEVEHVLVDGGSDDATLEMIRRNEDNLDWWCSEPDDGPAAALNKGIARTSGELIGCLNADDFYYPGTLATVHRVFRARPEIDVLSGHGTRVDEEGRPICRLYSDRWDLRQAVYGRCPVVQQATFFRRSVFERVGGFNEENHTCWDGELLVDMALEGARFHRIDADLGAFRMHEASISGSGDPGEAYRRDRKRIREKVTGKQQWGVGLKRRWHGLRRIARDPVVMLRRARERIRRPDGV